MKLGFAAVLTLIFITLKLTDVIAWSWWLVFMPLYLIPVLLLVGFVLFCIATTGK